MRKKKLAHTLDSDAERGGQYPNRNNYGSDRFGFAMAVRVGRIGRSRSQFQSAPNDGGAGDVERRFNAVGNKDVSVAEKPGHDFGRRHKYVDDEAQERDTRAGLQIIGGSLRLEDRGH